MSDTIIEQSPTTDKSPTIEELSASGRLSISAPEKALVSYVYLDDGKCVGTMWVELFNDDPSRRIRPLTAQDGFSEVCFDPHYKFPKLLKDVVGKGNWSRAEDALAKVVIDAKVQTRFKRVGELPPELEHQCNLLESIMTTVVKSQVDAGDALIALCAGSAHVIYNGIDPENWDYNIKTISTTIRKMMKAFPPYQTSAKH
jgi:hypothetical protein